MRRRCGWCCVELRWWQLNMCRVCKRDIVYAPSPTYHFGKRLFDRADNRKRWQ